MNSFKQLGPNCTHFTWSNWKLPLRSPKIRKLPLSTQLNLIVTWMGAGGGEEKVCSCCILVGAILEPCWAQPEQWDGSTNQCLVSVHCLQCWQLPLISPSALPSPNCEQHPCLWQELHPHFTELQSNAMKTHWCHCLTSDVLLSARPSKISGLLVFYCCTWVEWRKEYFFMVFRSAEVWFKGCQIDFRLVIMLFNVGSRSAWLLFCWSMFKYLPESEK